MIAQNHGESKDTKKWSDSKATNEDRKSFITLKFKTD